MVEIKKMFLTPNPYSRPQIKINKVTNIVIHWVGNANTSALANRNYFESLRNKKVFASSHYIIGLQGEIIQCMPETEVAYHASDANKYSIGIENCHPDWQGKFNAATYASLIDLCADLCKRYQLDSDKALIRHYDVTKKECPRYYVKNVEAWQQLKKDVKKALANLKDEKAGQDKELIEAIKGLESIGIKLDAGVWSNMQTMNMKYAKVAVERIGERFEAKSYKETINFLVRKGCITSRKLWDQEAFEPRWLRALFIKVYQKLVKKH